MSVVTVLTPNGRRQNVKITPNTTLLQVLEEVCAKHGFKPEDYDIRHHSKILDVSSIFRFSGLPNNAFLEMTEATKQRLESPVVLGLQLESGERVTGEFIPSDDLWKVIIALHPPAEISESPVVIYMRNEVFGKANLEKTTLRSLGLTGGRAVLRFFNRTSEELRTQANVSAVLSRTTASKERNVGATSPDLQGKGPKHSPAVTTHSLSDKNDTNNRTEVEEEFTSSISDRDQEKKTSPENSDSKEQRPEFEIAACLNTLSDNSKTMISETNINTDTETCNNTSERTQAEPEEESKAILLGERNAVAYNLNKIKPVEFEETSDDFYELTVADAKLLLRDAKQLCADLENAPLMTSAQRDLEKNKRILSLLNQYKKTVLRIKFPDRTVLQGTFSSVEKVSAVEKFVSEYLQNSDTKFYLYTTPPKQILKSDSNLLESNCVPCAVLYFGVPTDDAESKQFLRSDVLEKFSSPSAAALTAYESRGLVSYKIKENDRSCDNKIIPDVSDSIAGPSSSTHTLQGNQSAGQESSPPFKVPKWFKVKK